jgi:hypothetical protein
MHEDVASEGVESCFMDALIIRRTLESDEKGASLTVQFEHPSICPKGPILSIRSERVGLVEAPLPTWISPNASLSVLAFEACRHPN